MKERLIPLHVSDRFPADLVAAVNPALAQSRRLRACIVGACTAALLILFAAGLSTGRAAFAGPSPAAAPSAGATSPAPFLHSLFTDSMVLQRGVRVPFWGWTRPGQKVTVRMLGQSAEAVADGEGRWMARLGPFEAGGPCTVDVDGPQHVTLRDVLIGDVWLCSGQSNMSMGVGVAENGAEELSRANHPRIRLFTVPERVSWKPESTLEAGQWLPCTPANLARGTWGGFSATAYYFGRNLESELKVPIGLIHSSWGGTPAESWVESEALRTLGEQPGLQAALDMLRLDPRQARKVFEERMAAWWQRNDLGASSRPGWEDPAFQDAAWKTMSLPTAWELADLPDFDGVAWFRKAVDVPAEWAGRDLVLHLGPIDDSDTTWFNGDRVGAVDVWNTPRVYRVPGRLVKAGRNVIAVRVLDTGGGGGIYGKPGDMRLERADHPQDALALAGPWLYQALDRAEPLPPTPHHNQNTPTVLYNGMIAPLVPFALRGATWYQGESNAGRAAGYAPLLTTLIGNWRNRFAVGDFPFLIVQLASFTDREPNPGPSPWAALREAQEQVARRVPKTGLAVAIDIGDAKDVHPKNKQEVGRRLALAARAVAYGEELEGSGPLYRDMKIEQGRVRLFFTHGAGLQARGGRLEGFAVAGADRRFAWAEAVVEGDTVVVSSPDVARPVAVRYAWANNPACNLYNGAGLPASPFRTDAWPEAANK